MRRIPLVAALLMLMPAAFLLPLEVHLARLVFLDDSGGEVREEVRPEAELLRELAGMTGKENLVVRRVRQGAEDTPQTVLEAARLCERYGYSYLLYGYVKRTAYAYFAELKLFDRESRGIGAVFFASDDAAHYDRLVRDLASKIADYFYREVGLQPPANPIRPERNLLEISPSLGYWTPTGGDWDRVLAGLVSLSLAARFIPADPLFRLRSGNGWIAFGLEAEYGLGMNEPEYESFFLHAVRLRLSVEVLGAVGSAHALGAGVGLLVAIDTADQDRKYAPVFSKTAVAPGLSLSLQYRYSLSGSLSLGLINLFDVAAYEQPMVVYSPRVYVSFRLGPLGKEDDDE